MEDPRRTNAVPKSDPPARWRQSEEGGARPMRQTPGAPNEPTLDPATPTGHRPVMESAQGTICEPMN